MSGQTGGSNTALGDLKVIELATSIAGPFCGKLLADYGADVVKVELPEGDPSRAVGPFPAAERDAGALFLWLNADKRGIVLDWREDGGRRALRELLSRADVLVDSGWPVALGQPDLSPPGLEELNPRLIMVSITPFGGGGPWRDRAATGLTISALGGLSFVNGIAGQEPLKEPGPQTDLLAGLFGYVGTLSALAERSITGRGQTVDVSALEAVASVLTPQVTQHSYQGRCPRRPTAGDAFLFACGDGYLSMSVAPPDAWEFLTEVFGLGDAASEPAVATHTARAASPVHARKLLEPALASHSRAALFNLLGAARVNVGMALSLPELKEDPHLQSRGFFVAVEDPRAGELAHPGPPFRLGDSPWRIRRPAPRLGEHTEEVLATILRQRTY